MRQPVVSVRWSFALAALLVACGDGFVPAPVQAVSAATGDHYFATAWPDDRRLVDGALDTSGLPLGNASDLAKQSLIDNGNGVVRGFGTQAPMFVPFTGAIDEASLPASAEQSLAADASVFLVALDTEERVPIDTRFVADPTSWLVGNTLVARPMLGFPLRQGVQHALIVRTSVKDTAGKPIGPDRAMWHALHGEGAHYAALRAYLQAQKMSDVAIAVLFTTQEVVKELAALRDWAVAQPDPTPALALEREGPSYLLYEGSYAAPYLLHGDAPYVDKGGELRFEDGVPVVAKMEDMRVALCVPKTAPPPEGYPVVMYSHGTGGNYESVIYNICRELAPLGIAGVGIDQVLHGPRSSGTCLGMDAEYCFFNPLNPIAVRNLPRQTVIDHLSLRKALAHVSVAKLDMAKQAFFGHSQGGITGALFAAVDLGSHPRAVVLSGTGGNLTHTLLVRKDPLDFKALATGLLGVSEELDAFHPALAVIQTLVEAADPMNYASAWAHDGASQTLYITSGAKDPYTPALGTDAMVAAAGIPTLKPAVTLSPAAQLRGLFPVDGPHDGSAYQQFATGDHFAVNTAAAQQQWTTFIHGLFSTGIGTIPPLK